MERIGFIGLGLMGKPMAKNLLKVGYELVLYNRSRGPMEELAKLGAEMAESPSDLAERSAVIIEMVPDIPDINDVVFSERGVMKGVKEGSIFIDMSTNSPSYSKFLAEEFSKKGVEFLDAPVSGGDKGAMEGTLTIMVGGKEEVFERCLPIFRAMGRHIFYMGPHGSGQMSKLCNQIAVASNMAGICEALTLGSKAGLDLNKLVELIGSGAGGSWAMKNLAPKILKGDFEPGFKSSHLRKDLRYTIKAAEELNLALPFSSLLYQFYNSLVGKGLGEKGTQALMLLFKELNRL